MSEEEKIMLETNRSITNMETCFRNKIKELQHENKQLKEFNDKQKKIALELINFALKSDVDYVYVLEDLEKILNGEKTKWNKEHYWN